MVKLQLKNSDLVEISHSETLLINEAQDSLKLKQDKKIYKFGFGQSPFSPPEYAVESLKSNAFQHDYLPVSGLKACREAVAKAHQSCRKELLTGDDIVIAPGSKMIIFTVMACYKHAKVLLPQPSWVSYSPQASLLNHDVLQVPTSFGLKWKITPESLDQVCLENQSVDPFILVLNYPGNPTGMTYTAAELSDLAVIARKHQILIISDEIYGWLTHSNHHVSIAEFYPEGTFITTGLSKWCGAGGWRFGAGILPLNVSSEFKKTYNGIASETYSTTAAPVQFAATNIYKNMEYMMPFMKEQQTILRGLSLQIVAMFNEKSEVKVHQPDGGFYIFPDFFAYKDRFQDKGINTCEQFCVDVLNTKGVAMLPASAFGFTGDDFYTRMCYVDFDGTKAISALNNGDSLDAVFFHKYCSSVVDGIAELCDYLNSV